MAGRAGLSSSSSLAIVAHLWQVIHVMDHPRRRWDLAVWADCRGELGLTGDYFGNASTLRMAPPAVPDDSLDSLARKLRSRTGVGVGVVVIVVVVVVVVVEGGGGGVVVVLLVVVVSLVVMVSISG